MSPVSVNGVAAIVYTPFADASSSWFMVCTCLESAVFSFAENVVELNLYLASTVRQPICHPPIGSNTHLALVPAHSACPAWPGCYSARNVRWADSRDVHDPICAFD